MSEFIGAIYQPSGHKLDRYGLGCKCRGYIWGAIGRVAVQKGANVSPSSVLATGTCVFIIKVQSASEQQHYYWVYCAKQRLFWQLRVDYWQAINRRLNCQIERKRKKEMKGFIVHCDKINNITQGGWRAAALDWWYAEEFRQLNNFTVDSNKRKGDSDVLQLSVGFSVDTRCCPLKMQMQNTTTKQFNDKGFCNIFRCVFTHSAGWMAITPPYTSHY